MTDPIAIRPATAAEVIDLRHAVLRADLPRETAVFPGDDNPAARHFVAVCSDDENAARVVACVTLHPSTYDGRPAWQLRGMAVAAELRGQGIGAKLLDAVDRAVATEAVATEGAAMEGVAKEGAATEGAATEGAATEALRADAPPRVLWCNARVAAKSFYERHGWRVVSEIFHVPTAGPHVRMVRAT